MRKLTDEQIEILGRYADFLIQQEKDRYRDDDWKIPAYILAAVIAIIGIIEFIKWL